MEGETQSFFRREEDLKSYMLRKSKTDQNGAMCRGLVFPAKHICRWKADIGDRSSSRRPRKRTDSVVE